MRNSKEQRIGSGITALIKTRNYHSVLGALLPNQASFCIGTKNKNSLHDVEKMTI